MKRIIAGTWRRKLAALALIGAIIGGTATFAATASPVAPAQEAQAFADIHYYANCPGSARSQQLVFINRSGAPQRVQGQAGWQLGYRWLQNQNPTLSVTESNYGYGAITYWTQIFGDDAHYYITGDGNLDWNYFVYCYY